MNAIFFDSANVEDKKNITYGGTVRKYYSQLALKQAGYKLKYITNLKDLLSFSTHIFMEKKILWFHYPARRSVSLIAIFTSLITRRKLILTLHDSPIEQQIAVDGRKYTFLQRNSIRLIEPILLLCSSYIIVAAPGILNYFKPLKWHCVVIMPPGVSTSELRFPDLNKTRKSNKKIAVYFGSMKRNKAIPTIISIFSKLNDWELHLFGPLDGEEIVQSTTVKYFGQTDHNSLKKKLENADVILIPYPNNEYLNICMPMKLGSALVCCKPIISTNLQGISEYVSYVGLNENVIYINEWNEDNVIKALKESERLSIDKEITLDKMNKMAWEPRFSELIEIISNNSKSFNNDNTKWI